MKRTVFINDKVVLLREYDKLKQVGNTYEVGGITESAIVLREVKTKIAIAAIAIEDFDNYFIKAENVGRKFTPWTSIVDPNGDLIAFYRTNHKKVQVKIHVCFNAGYNTDFVKGEASCNKNDEFNLYFGIQLAIAKALDKFYRQYKLTQPKENNSIYKEIEPKIKHNQNNIKNMLDSLKSKTEG